MIFIQNSSGGIPEIQCEKQIVLILSVDESADAGGGKT